MCDAIRNLNSPLTEVFPELEENTKIMRWLKPTETVARLTAMMDEFGIRHIPIIDSNSDRPEGDLKALISLVDCAKLLTPPAAMFPPKHPLTHQERKNIAAFSRKIAATSIEEAFPELFGETLSLSVRNARLRDVFTNLTQMYQGKNLQLRRYRTLPVFDQNQLLVGTISYTDVLRKIKGCQGNERFLKMKVEQIYKSREDVLTLPEDETLLCARQIFKDNPFTHIPITREEESPIVTGIVDDVLIVTFLHEILFERFSNLPLKDIAPPVTEKNTVKADAHVADAIDKFVPPPPSRERPTAILAYKKDRNEEEFVLEGIVSYTDILKSFKASLENRGNAEPEQVE